ncbi:MAG: helix-turn-helix transcriptional regulator [Patescibacteria group bacterium]|nr:helix-turn-helix transcriptional regulator [Patescibacteria group bacterium]
MNKQKHIPPDLDEILKEKKKDKKFKVGFDECGKQLELTYLIMQLRKKKNFSQAQLAEKIGTTQSNIARFESGNQNFTMQFLQKIVFALGGELEIIVK